jgi:hypothetical protein
MNKDFKLTFAPFTHSENHEGQDMHCFPVVAASVIYN